jgi:hypothetical protein
MAILNLTPGPLVVNFTPRAELGPQEWNLSPKGNVHPLCRRMEGRTENLTPGDNFAPKGQNSTPEDNCAPRVKVSPKGKVKNGPLTVDGTPRVPRRTASSGRVVPGLGRPPCRTCAGWSRQGTGMPVELASIRWLWAVSKNILPRHSQNY